MLSLENSFRRCNNRPVACLLPLKCALTAASTPLRKPPKTLEMDMNYCSKGRIDKAGELVIKANYSDIPAAMQRINWIRNQIILIILLVTSGPSLYGLNYSDCKIRRLGSINAWRVTTAISVCQALQERADLKLAYSDVKMKDVSPLHLKAGMWTYSTVTW